MNERQERPKKAEKELTDAEMTQELFKIYGRELTAYMTHLDIDNPERNPYEGISAVTKWANGIEFPSQEDKITLKNIYDITQLLRQVEKDDVINGWILGMNPHLEDESPARFMRSHPEKVRNAAEIFIQDNF